MSLKLIVAYDNNRLIGKGNELPWRLKEDLKYFKKETLENYVVMGRRTYESLPKGLPDRDLFILSNNKSYELKRSRENLVNSIEEVLSLVKEAEEKGKEVFIIGGKEIYSLFLNYVDELYITEIDDEFDGDVYFPEWNKDLFNKIEGNMVEENGIEFRFNRYIRI